MSQIAALGSISIFKLPLPEGSGATAVVFFRAPLHCDVDGSKDAYGPRNSGRDYTANAGEKDHWWALVTDKHGDPIVDDGFYVSTTSLQDPAFPIEDRRRYVDAQAIPYIVLPAAHYRAWGVQIGDLAWVQKLEEGQVACGCAAIFADAGPNVGEGSAELLRRLSINPDPRHGGTDQARVQCYVFCGSGIERPLPADAIEARVQAMLPALRSLSGLAAPITAGC